MKTLGFGPGLRPNHYDTILSERPSAGFFEALTENDLVPGDKAIHYLERIRDRYPIILHGALGFSIRHVCADVSADSLLA